MNWFWKKKKTSRVNELEIIASILFPQYTTETTPQGEFFHVDYSTISNLECVLSDLQDGYNDLNSQNTINYVIKCLIQVRTILEAYPELDTRVKQIIVDIRQNEEIKENDKF
jgi:hypothetical protein